MFGATHPIRIYRNSRAVKHDLHTVLSLEDTLGVDTAATFIESDSEMITSMDEMGISTHPAKMLLPRGIDVRPNYYIEVKKPMVLDGRWCAVATTASSALSAGDTEIPVVSTIGFEAGDQLLIKDANGEELSLVKSVGDDSLTLYGDVALIRDYESGATVRSSRFFQVVTERWPHQIAGYRTFEVVETMKVVSS